MPADSTVRSPSLSNVYVNCVFDGVVPFSLFQGFQIFTVGVFHSELYRTEAHGAVHPCLDYPQTKTGTFPGVLDH